MVLDDSYISFRYARNLAQGEGLVFNPGERVEGYTNFLWTVLLAAAIRAGADPVLASEVLAAAAAVGALVLLALLGRRLVRGPGKAVPVLLPPLLFAGLGAEARHVVSGMETLLFTFLVLAAFACLEWRRPGAFAAGLVFGLAALTRPEGVLYAGLAALGLAVAPARPPDDGAAPRASHRLREPLLLAAGVSTFTLPHLAWRLAYYGHPVPNTFYAKVAGPHLLRLERGAESLVKLVGDLPVWPVLVLALFALPAVRARRFWAFAVAVVVATWAYFVAVGGDFLFFFGARLLLPALPFVLLLAAEGLRRVVAAVPSRAAGTGLAGAVLLGLLGFVVMQPRPTRGGRLGGLMVLHESWHETGRWLARKTTRDALLAAPAAGIVPYVADRRTVDMYGLTDEHIAHQAPVSPAGPPAHGKTDAAYVLRRRPDYLVAVDLDAAGRPVTAGLAGVRGRVARSYGLAAMVKCRRGRTAPGGWVIETDRFRPNLFRKGYVCAILRRVEGDEASSP